jgi:hypothetical protein
MRTIIFYRDIFSLLITEVTGGWQELRNGRFIIETLYRTLLGRVNREGKMMRAYST